MNKHLGKLATKSAQGEHMVIKSVFPFNFWPDTVTLEKDKLIVYKRTGPWSGQHIPVEYKDLFNIEILEAPMFCTVRVISKYVTGGQVDLPYFRKHEGYELQEKALELKKEATSSDESGGQ
jgi:hypothetical protein